MTRSRVLLVTLGLLALATSASAECAWVAWVTDSVYGDASRWQVYPPMGTAFGPRKECEVSQKVARDTNAREGLFFVCLPDTVDPRESKGK
jgi:hypothetical protein